MSYSAASYVAPGTSERLICTVENQLSEPRKIMVCYRYQDVFAPDGLAARISKTIQAGKILSFTYEDLGKEMYNGMAIADGVTFDGLTGINSYNDSFKDPISLELSNVPFGDYYVLTTDRKITKK